MSAVLGSNMRRLTLRLPYRKGFRAGCCSLVVFGFKAIHVAWAATSPHIILDSKDSERRQDQGTGQCENVALHAE